VKLTRSILRGALLGCMSIFIPVAAAQSGPADYPQRPVRVVVPFAPGGATDIIARILSPKLSERLGQQFVVDNRAGAAGNIAVELVAAAQPDGYTLLVGNISTNSINPLLFAGKMKADAMKDLAGITLLASIPNAIVGGPKVPANTLQEVIAYIRERPGQFNYQAPLGSYSHLDMLALLSAAGIKMVHLPSAGAGGTVAALLRGEILISNSNVASNIGAIRAGQIKAFAVTSAQRVPELPEVPTLAEAGFPGIGSLNWNGFFVPVRTPRPVIDKLYATIVAAMREPEMQDFLAKRLIPVTLSASPKDLDDYVRAEARKWAKIIKDNQVKIE
jgi:tripartite-type tricarboxylate transporter receptor subunit TctC